MKKDISFDCVELSELETERLLSDNPPTYEEYRVRFIHDLKEESPQYDPALIDSFLDVFDRVLKKNMLESAIRLHNASR